MIFTITEVWSLEALKDYLNYCVFSNLNYNNLRLLNYIGLIKFNFFK